MKRIADVAARAGVSPATVSRVLNGSPTVGADYQHKVSTAIAELGYRPNRLASNLRRLRTEMIGVVVSDIENPHFTAMVRSVEDAAYEMGYRLLLCNTDEDPNKQAAYLEVLGAERVLGVILAPTDSAGREIAKVLDLNIPIVAFDRAVTDPRADAVVVNNEGAAVAATELLLKAGHRAIGFVSGPDTIETGAERLAGYQRTMNVARLPVHTADGGFRIDGGREAARKLLTETPKLTALIVANNLMTIGALDYLNERGVQIPGEVALVAIDDPFWAPLVNPPLTTLAQPVRAMGQTAVQLLLERVTGRRTESRHVSFDCELRVRRSCGTNQKAK